MKQVEFVSEKCLLPGYPDPFTSGDVKSLPDELAQTCIENGWARDKETGEIGERKPGARGIVQPCGIKQKTV